MLASMTNRLPRNLLIVRALAGDSTIMRALPVAAGAFLAMSLGCREKIGKSVGASLLIAGRGIDPQPRDAPPQSRRNSRDPTAVASRNILRIEPAKTEGVRKITTEAVGKIEGWIDRPETSGTLFGIEFTFDGNTIVRFSGRQRDGPLLLSAQPGCQGLT